MRRSGIVASAVLLSCSVSCGRIAETPKPKLSQDHRPVIRQLTGRVMLDGSPMKEFVVSTSRHSEGSDSGAVTRVVASDGAFQIPLAEGRQYVIVAGRGFAREIVQVDVLRDHPISPITIEVRRGHRVEGRVIDAGRPLANANVSLMQYQGTSTGEVLWELVRGNYHTKSDVNGNFVIEDVKLVSTRRARIEASSTAGRSMTHVLYGDHDHVVDLVVLPVGEIFGVVGPGPLGPFWGIVMARSVIGSTWLSATTAPDGTFTISKVPSGEWDIGTFAAASSSSVVLQQRIIVSGGQRTNVSLIVR
jgi:hypothetical protein